MSSNCPYHSKTRASTHRMCRTCNKESRRSITNRFTHIVFKSHQGSQHTMTPNISIQLAFSVQGHQVIYAVRERALAMQTRGRLPLMENFPEGDNQCEVKRNSQGRSTPVADAATLVGMPAHAEASKQWHLCTEQQSLSFA